MTMDDKEKRIKDVEETNKMLESLNDMSYIKERIVANDIKDLKERLSACWSADFINGDLITKIVDEIDYKSMSFPDALDVANALPSSHAMTHLKSAGFAEMRRRPKAEDLLLTIFGEIKTLNPVLFKRLKADIKFKI